MNDDVGREVPPPSVPPVDAAQTPSASHPVATGLRDGLVLGASKLAQGVLAVLALKAVLRISTEHDYGLYQSFLFVANVAIAFLSWPVLSVLRLGSEEWNEHRKLGRTFVLHLLLVLGSFALLAAPVWQARELVDRYVCVPSATWIVLAYALLSAAGSVLAAHLKPSNAILGFALLPLLTRVLWVATLASCALFSVPLDARGIMLACAATAVPQLLVGLGLVGRKAMPLAVPRSEDAQRALHFGLPVLLRQLGMVAFAYVNLVALKHQLGVEDAGRFQVAGTLAEQTALLAVALEDLMGPILARAAARGEERVLGTYYKTIAPQVVLGWSALVGAALVLAFPILAALSAKSVAASGQALQVLFVAAAVRMIVTLESPVFDAHLISKPPLVFFALGFAANLGLDMVLIPHAGIEGAAWATAAGWLLNALLRSVYLSLRFGVRSLSLYVWLTPALVALAWARFLGGHPVRDLGFAIVLLAATLLMGRVLRVFAPETLDALEGVRMPGRVRKLLARLYGAKPA